VRIEKLAAVYRLEVRFVHYPLHPETPDGGRTLEELFAGRGMDVSASQKRLGELAAAEGLPWGNRTHTYNSRLAQELGVWADSEGKARLHDALFRAYFVDGINLGDVEELARIAESTGLSGPAAREVLTSRRFRKRVDEDWARSRTLQIPGVPAFRAGENSVVGAQPFEMLERLVLQAGVERRTPPPGSTP